MSSWSSSSSNISRRIAATQHHPTKLLNMIRYHTQIAIIIILFSPAIKINQPSWCLQSTIYSDNNASPVLSDQVSNQNTHYDNKPSNYQPTAYYDNNEDNNNAKQSTNIRLKTVPIEQYHRPNQLAATPINTSSGSHLASSQINQSNVRPSGMQQSGGSSGQPISNNNQPPSPISSNVTGRRNRDSDSLIEGSGDGPVSGTQKHQPAGAKFDDTEEGEDDDDDDDYDYKDSLDNGSGHINRQPAVIKQPEHDEKQTQQGNNQLKKPNSANDEAYLPFRPATSGKPSSTTVVPPLTRPTTKDTPASLNSPKSPTQSNVKLEQSAKPDSSGRAMGSNSSNENAVVTTENRNTVQITSGTPATIDKLSPDFPETITMMSTTTTTTSRPRQNVSVPTTTASPPIVSFDNQLRIPSIQVSTQSPISTKYKHQNTTTTNLTSPYSLDKNSTSKSKSDVDYDYEDESDDEDSDDVSNFEDNEAPQDNFNTLNSTISQLVPSNNNNKQQAATIPTKIVTPVQAITTTTPVVVPRPTTMPNPPTTTTTSRPYFTSNQMNYSMNFPPNYQTTIPNFSTQSPSFTMAPPIISPPPLDDEDDEDSKTDEELEEEEEEDEDDDDDAEESNLQRGHTNPIKPSLTQDPADIPSPPPRWPSQLPPSTQLPAYNEFVNEHYKPGNNIQTSQPGNIKTTTQMPSPRVIPTSPSKTTTTTTTTTTLATLPSTTTTTTSTTTTTTTSTTTMAPTTTSTTTTTSAPVPPIKPTIAPIRPAIPPAKPTPFYASPTTTTTTTTTMRPVSIRYATTPRMRTTTPVTRITNIIPYDNRSSPEGDVELTRQIYDKAIEVYQATNKAINAAVEAVWPPSFEVNSETFEPLLVQPFLFMFVLGAAIIGLVLTMMLVVYIISYQIQPKEEDVSIYSHS